MFVRNATLELYLLDRTPFISREVAAWQFDHGIVGVWFDGILWGLSLCTFLLNRSFRLAVAQRMHSNGLEC